MMWFLRPFLPYILIGTLTLAGTTGVYLYVRQQGVEAERRARLNAEISALKAELARSAAISKRLEGTLAEEKANVRQINERLSDERTNHVVYRECVLPDSGLRVLNSNRSASPTAR